jgi:hypothetical protein
MNKEFVIFLMILLFSGAFAWITHDFVNGVLLGAFAYCVKFAVSMLEV